MVKTTVGSILVNDHLPTEMRDYDKVYDKKTLYKVLGDVGRKYPGRYAEVTKAVKDLGDLHSYLEGASFSLDDVSPIDTSNIQNKYKKEFIQARSIKDPKKQEQRLREVNIKIEDEVNTLVKKDLKNPNRFTSWASSGARGSAADMRQLRYSVGNMIDVKNEMFPHRANNSFAKGLSPMEFYIGSIGARKGIVGSFLSVRDPGAFNKELANLTNDMLITENDCNTRAGKTYKIDEKAILDRYLLNNVGTYRRNDIVTTRMREQLKSSDVKQIDVRSPLYCKAKEGVCAMCTGLLEDGTVPKIGDTVGLRSSQSVAEKLTQMALESKHSGGIAQKRTAFEQIKQNMHVPENFPGSAVLSRVSGKIKKVEKAGDGGNRVFIGEEMHYLTPAQGLKVKVGDQVEKGDVISEGIINPAEVTKLKGMYAGREYLSKALHQIYKDNGIDSHPKVFETIVRGTMNLGKVQDNGDYNFDSNETVRWNQVQHLTQKIEKERKPLDAVGYRVSNDYSMWGVSKGTKITTEIAEKLDQRLFGKKIKVYKNPLKVDPVVLGTERAALHKGDWLSNLGFRFLKNTFIENASLGRSSNIHSYDPIPSYAYSSEFGKGEQGRF